MTDPDPQPCPHCGSTKDPWFSRSYCGEDMFGPDGIGYYCQDCGNNVDFPPEPKKKWWQIWK